MSEPWEGGDSVKGAKIYKERCAQCHSIKKGANHTQGPNLYNCVGSKSGTKSGYNYTKANIEKGVIWTKQNLYDYLLNPKAYIPGTRMVFPGIKSEKERRDLIAFMDKNKD